MYNQKNRIIDIYFDVLNVQEVLSEIELKYKKELIDLYVVDTVSDFNQNKWLGQELNDTVIYINPQTRINSVLSVIGCIKGGCLAVFAFEKGTYGDFYLDFFIPKLKLIQNKAKESLSLISNLSSNEEAATIKSPNEEWSKLKDLVHNNRIVHVIGERGTGKSTLLGKLIDDVVKQVKCSSYPIVILISPSKKSSYNTLINIKSKNRDNLLYSQGANLNYKDLCNANLVIVDEAASFNKALITKLRSIVSANLVFSTTLDGYETTGQSYRLSNLVDTNDAVLNLTIIKRFSKKDPLHHLSQQLCQPSLCFESDFDLADGFYSVFDLNVSRETVLLAAFSLLQQSHYRTTPNDLANLIDTNGKLIVMVKKREVIGAIHLIQEEIQDKDEELITQILYGRRRLKNAMTQQQLIHAYGEREVAEKKIMRISRIAVKKSERREKNGEKIIKYIEEVATKNAQDYISTSFSYQSGTFDFWLSQKFLPVHIGINRNKWHDSFAILMMKRICKKNNDYLITQLHKRFCYHISFYSEDYSKQEDLRDRYVNDNSVFVEDSVNVKEMFASTLDNYRDINWVLPHLCLIKDKDSIDKNLKEVLVSFQKGLLLEKSEKKSLLKKLKEMNITFN